MVLSKYRDGRLSTVDTNDILGVVAGTLGGGMLSGGLPTSIYGVDFATLFSFDVGGYTFGIPFFLVVGSVLYILYTNQMLDEAQDLVDINSVEGISFLGAFAGGLVAVIEPQFFVDYVSGVTGGPMYGAMAYTAFHAVANSVLATQ